MSGGRGYRFMASTPASWSELRRDAGRVYGPVRAADTVELGAIRQVIEALDWDEPIHRDRAAARRAGYRTITAPAAATRRFASPAYWQPNAGPRKWEAWPVFVPLPGLLPEPGHRLMNAAFKQQIYRPLYLGERLTTTYKLLGCTDKQTRLGPGTFFRLMFSYQTVGGALVAEDTWDVFHYQYGARKHVDTSRHESENAIPSVAPSCSVEIAVPYQRMIMWTAAERDFSPIHFDGEFARSSGAPDAFANTYFVEALYERLLRSISGSMGTIGSIEFRMTDFLTPTTRLLAEARIEERAVEGNELAVAIVQLADGRVTSYGDAVVVPGHDARILALDP